MKQVCIDLPGLRYVRVGCVSILNIGRVQRLRVGNSIIWHREPKPGEAAAA